MRVQYTVVTFGPITDATSEGFVL